MIWSVTSDSCLLKLRAREAVDCIFGHAREPARPRGETRGNVEQARLQRGDLLLGVLVSQHVRQFLRVLAPGSVRSGFGDLVEPLNRLRGIAAALRELALFRNADQHGFRLRTRKHALNLDHRVVLEAPMEIGEVVIHAQREAHPLDRRAELSAVGRGRAGVAGG